MSSLYLMWYSTVLVSNAIYQSSLASLFVWKEGRPLLVVNYYYNNKILIHFIYTEPFFHKIQLKVLYNKIKDHVFDKIKDHVFDFIRRINKNALAIKQIHVKPVFKKV